MATKKYLDENGAVLLNQLLATKFNTKADKTEIPTKTSDLTNDSNFPVDANYVHTDNNYTTTEKNKLNGIESGAQVNKIETIKVNNVAQTITSKAVDITVPTNNNQLINGAGYITKNVDDLTNYTTTSDMNNLLGDKLDASLKGAANGLAELDENGKVPSSQLPAYVDDVVEGYYYNGKFYKEAAHTTEITGETGKIYVDLPTNVTYRWGGSAYVEISSSLALGETSSTAYYGDKGKIAYDHATDANRLTTAKSSAFYKFATTAEGHIKSVTAVAKSDLTGLGVEDASNKVTSISGSSTDAQYPSAKLLYDQLALKQGTLTAGSDISITNNTISVDGDVINKVTSNSIRIWDLDTGVYNLIDNDVSVVYYNGATSTSGALGIYGGLLYVYSLTSTTKAWFFMSDNQTDPYFYLGSTTATEGTITRLMKKSEIKNNLTTTAEGYMLDARQGKALNDAMEKKSNKVTSISSSSTDTQYPSAKLVYDQLALKYNTTDGDLISIINTSPVYIKDLTSGIYKVNGQDRQPISLIYKTENGQDYSRDFNFPIYLTVNADGIYRYYYVYCLYSGNQGLYYGMVNETGLGTDLKHIAFDQIQKTTNLVTSISSHSGHTTYPSAKCVYDQLALKLNTADLVALTNQEVNNIFDFELANS